MADPQASTFDPDSFMKSRQQPPAFDPDAFMAERQQASHSGTTSGTGRTGDRLKGSGDLASKSLAYPGLARAGEEPGNPDAMAAGAANELEELGKAASPALLGAFGRAPVSTLISTAAGIPVQKAIRWAGEKLGFPGMGQLAGDAAGAAAGTAAGRFAPIPGSQAGPLRSPIRVAPFLEALRAAAPDVASGGAKIAAGEAVARAVPPLEWPLRLGVGYPGAKQAAAGFAKGGNAFKGALSDGPLLRSPITPVAPSRTPAWRIAIPGEQPPAAESPANVPGAIAIPPAVPRTLPSGRVVGTGEAVTPATPAAPSRAPLWRGIPLETQTGAPDFSPVGPLRLPSGRIPGTGEPKPTSPFTDIGQPNGTGGQQAATGAAPPISMQPRPAAPTAGKPAPAAAPQAASLSKGDTSAYEAALQQSGFKTDPGDSSAYPGSKRGVSLGESFQRNQRSQVAPAAVRTFPAANLPAFAKAENLTVQQAYEALKGAGFMIPLHEISKER